jgi:hypothetical protein
VSGSDSTEDRPSPSPLPALSSPLRPLEVLVLTRGKSPCGMQWKASLSLALRMLLMRFHEKSTQVAATPKAKKSSIATMTSRVVWVKEVVFCRYNDTALLF